MDKKRAKKELDKLDPNLIESMNVLGKCPENMADGANGVIEIITKKNKPFEISH
jgi:hypothetical protein